MIFNLYNLLYEINKSAVVGLNRAVVAAQIHGATAGIEEINNLPDREMLDNYYLYHSTLGELYVQKGDLILAKKYFEKAISMTTSEAEKKLLKKKLGEIEKADGN